MTIGPDGILTEFPEGTTPLPSGVTQASIDQHTIQALVELVYVRTGNEVIASSLMALEDALSVTKTTLDTLTGLQTLHNQLTVTSRPAFSTFFDYKSAYGDADAYMKAYASAASAYFGTPIDPVFIYSNASQSGFIQFQKDITLYRTQLAQEISALTKITPQLKLPNGQLVDDPNTLLAKLKTIYGQLSGTTTFSGCKTWVLDSYNVHASGVTSQAGQIQQNLTNAITAGQSLNDTQKEAVRRYLFVFEEYYKSAAAVLTKVTQLIEKMAQNIAR